MNPGKKSCFMADLRAKARYTPTNSAIVHYRRAFYPALLDRLRAASASNG
jgi:hypothetical protein